MDLPLCPEAVDLKAEIAPGGLRRRLSLPWRLTRREGSASSDQNLKADFATNTLRITEARTILLPITGSSRAFPAISRTDGVRHFEPSLNGEKNFI
jgi:hypothetical protein